ncbi:MAG: hypothetical protein U5N58_11960 [Actinomycetota bacterium]|nr:hypothetical protein [Actinomycetota bacterium]
MELSETDKTNYFYNSYIKADGLWFLKPEQDFSFNQCSQTDQQLLPKFQARFLKSRLKKDKGIDALCQCLETKLDLDNFHYKILRKAHCLKVNIFRCPWHHIMITSGREHLSAALGPLMCDAQYGIWASEFGKVLEFGLDNTICRGSHMCVLEFRKVD